MPEAVGYLVKGCCNSENRINRGSHVETSDCLHSERLNALLAFGVWKPEGRA